MGKLKTGAAKLYHDFFKYWNQPKEGQYLSNKEFVIFSFGWTASDSVSAVTSYVTFAASCFLVGSIYGISFQSIFMIGVIGLPFGYIWGPLGMSVTDNLGRPPKQTMRLINYLSGFSITIAVCLFLVDEHLFEAIVPGFPRILAVMFLMNPVGLYFGMFKLRWLSPRFGKYRPAIVIGVVPTIVVLLLLVYLPIGSIDSANRLWVIYLLFAVYGLFSNFSDQVSNLINVISPNSQERLNLLSYGEMIAGILPGVVGILLPIFAMYTGGMTDIRTFRIVIPAFVIFFAPFTLLMAFKSKERVILEKNHKPNVNLLEGFREVLKNKYFWIMNFFQLAQTLAGGVIIIANLMFIYALRMDWVLGVYGTILTSAAIPGQVLAPTLVRKFGKRAIVLAGGFTTVLQLIISYYAISSGNLILFFIVSYIGYIINSISVKARRSMGPDIWDYQQWLSGKRLEVSSGVFNLIFTPFNVMIAMVVPTVYGILGFTSDWDVLYNDAIRNKIFLASLGIMILSALLSVLPFLFYDLTSDKHKKIIEDLKQRAQEKDDAAEQESLLTEQASPAD